MEYNSSYYLFKSDIKPMWEHEDNMGGGKWVVQLKAPNHVDDVWQNVMLAIVGEAFDGSSDSITGAVVNRRRAGDRVAVWLRKSSDELIADLGEKIKAAATDGLEVDITYSFSVHNAEPPTPQGEQ
jgi:translation initiation factor 4E